MFEGAISARLANKYFEKEIFKVVKTRAALGALIMAIPDFGLGGIIFIAVLWNMYSKICEKVGISFRENMGKLIGLGMIVNILVAIILDLALTTFFFIAPFILYAQFYLSGKFFVESLKQLDIRTNESSSSSQNIKQASSYTTKHIKANDSIGFPAQKVFIYATTSLLGLGLLIGTVFYFSNY